MFKITQLLGSRVRIQKPILAPVVMILAVLCSLESHTLRRKKKKDLWWSNVLLIKIEFREGKVLLLVILSITTGPTGLKVYFKKFSFHYRRPLYVPCLGHCTSCFVSSSLAISFSQPCLLTLNPMHHL